MDFLLVGIPGILLGVKDTVIDIFCDVIDNYGDIAIAYRLAKDLAKRGSAVRLLVNDLSTFRSLVPEVDCSPRQSRAGIEIIDTRHPESPRIYARMEHEVLIEAFGCAVPEDFFEGFIPQPGESRLVINLEYLSAEGWTGSYHEKESLTGIEGIRKYFFLPGFTEDSGGLILDDDFLTLKSLTEGNRLQARSELCLRYGVDASLADRGCLVTLFSYRRNLKPLLRDLGAMDRPAVVFAASGASTQPITGSVPEGLKLVALPFLPQAEYDRLLLASDINLVRGEDSLMRAVIAGKPFLWHAYLQEGGTHMEKVDAFSRHFASFFSDAQLGESVRALLLSYNDRSENASETPLSEDFSPFLARLGEVEAASRRLSASVIRNGSLADRLLAFSRRIRAGQ
jgi:uncharacterized repeat protein (TIGR03837 family)